MCFRFHPVGCEFKRTEKCTIAKPKQLWKEYIAYMMLANAWPIVSINCVIIMLNISGICRCCMIKHCLNRQRHRIVVPFCWVETNETCFRAG